MTRSRHVLLPLCTFGLLGSSACQEPTSPAARYLAEVGGLVAPAEAPVGDTVVVTFQYQLRDCAGLHAVEIRQTWSELRVAVWGNALPPNVDCTGEVILPVDMSILLLPGSRQSPFTIVLRHPSNDLRHTIVHP